MKKTTILFLSILLLTVLQTGCSCQHQWTEADCTTPKTCTQCQVTEGEALGHSWQEADCVTAKTCSRCGTTEGSPLGHTWTEATCTAPKTCTHCGAAEGQPLEHSWEGEATLYTAPICSVCGAAGDPLPGYLAQNGLAPNAKPNQIADYITSTYVRSDINTTGSFMASDISIFDSDGIYRAKKGYEWRSAEILIHFGDNHAALYGTKVAFARGDFYQDLELKQGKKQDRFTVNYNGKDYKCMAYYENVGYQYEVDGILFHMTCYVQVPVGYDGVVLAFYNGNIDIKGMHLHEVEDENMLLFRMA